MLSGQAGRVVSVRFSLVSRKAELVDEAQRAGLTLSEFVERVVFSMSRSERLLAARVRPERVDEVAEA